MGTCWKCKTDVFLKDEEVRCDRCKEIVRYWCNSCKQPFDVEDKETKKKIKECKWCWYFKCPNCGACGENCSKHEHINFIKKTMNGIIPVDKWNELNRKAQKIVDYFEEIKMGKEKTTCAFGVPKTYAKERIKQILARMKGFRVRSVTDRDAFDNLLKEVTSEEEGYEFTIKNTREDGSYGQEYRDVFNLCVCMGTLKYERKHFKDKKTGVEIGYDSWTRVEEEACPYLDTENLIVKICPKCQRVYDRNETYCFECTYPRGGKKHEKGSRFELIEKLSDNPTCTNLSSFKKGGWEEEDGFERET